MMNLNPFQIKVLIAILFIACFAWYKLKISHIFNYLLGSIFIVLYIAIDSLEGALLAGITLIFYNVLFVSSLCIYFISKKNRKEYFFLFPKIFYSIIVFIEVFLINPFGYFYTKFCGSLLPIFIAFFPLNIMLYYRKYK